MLKIYIAGPDLFEQSHELVFNIIRNKCKEKGFEALIPTDNEVSLSNDIYEANLDMIVKADIVIANLNPFRGKEPDSGTCFEVGFAFAHGKPVVGYTSIKDWADHIGKVHINPDTGMDICSEGYLIEDFGNRQNLMIEHSCEEIVDTFDEALDVVCEILPF